MGLGCSEFVLVPVITGAFFGGKGFSFGLIALGIVLLALAMPGIGLLAFGPTGTISAGIQTAMIPGTGLLFTGIAGLFAPGMPEEGKQEGQRLMMRYLEGALRLLMQEPLFRCYMVPT